MKRALLLVSIIGFFVVNTMAQKVNKEQNEAEDDITKGGFKKENLFTGGTVDAGFSNFGFNIGLGPYFGYSINRYVDVAASFNYSYASQRDNFDFKIRQSVIAPGAFVRVYPVKFLFAHAQYDQNYIQQKTIPPNSNNSSFKQIVNVGTFLVGAGYAQGRQDGPTFYYISLLFDVAKNINSPYTDTDGNIIPIIRAGFNIALFQGNAKRAQSSRKRRDYY